MVFKIMAVDDEPEILQLIKVVVEPLEMEVLTSPDSREAAQRVESEVFDGFLVHARMPHLDGFQSTESIRHSPANSTVSMTMLTGADDVETMRKGFHAGVTFSSTAAAGSNRLIRKGLVLALGRELARHMPCVGRGFGTCSEPRLLMLSTDHPDVGEYQGTTGARTSGDRYLQVAHQRRVCQTTLSLPPGHSSATCSRGEGRPGGRGITLIEAMVATVIALLGVCGLGSVIFEATVVNKNQGTENTRATIYAQDKIENLLALDFASCTKSSSSQPAACNTTGITARGWTQGLLSGGSLAPADLDRRFGVHGSHRHRGGASPGSTSLFPFLNSGSLWLLLGDHAGQRGSLHRCVQLFPRGLRRAQCDGSRGAVRFHHRHKRDRHGCGRRGQQRSNPGQQRHRVWKCGDRHGAYSGVHGQRLQWKHQLCLGEVLNGPDVDPTPVPTFPADFPTTAPAYTLSGNRSSLTLPVGAAACRGTSFGSTELASVHPREWPTRLRPAGSKHCGRRSSSKTESRHKPPPTHPASENSPTGISPPGRRTNTVNALRRTNAVCGA